MKYAFFGGMVLWLAFVPQNVFASGSATFSLDALRYEVRQGEKFDVIVSVNGHGEELDTVRAVVTYHPDRLRAQSASLIGAFERTAPGNEIDHAQGKVSWGGFTLNEPVTGETPFIRITFLAIQDGETKIQVSPDSRLIVNGEERINTKELPSASVQILPSAESQPGTALLLVESLTHPNDVDWYQSSDVEFFWTAVIEDSEIAAYYYSFDQDPDGEPTQYVGAQTNQIALSARSDGIYYLHLKAVQEDGRESAEVDRAVHIDKTAPNPLAITFHDDQIVEGESLWMTFATTDETSGIARYEVAINDSPFQAQESPLELVDWKAGTYFIQVAAVDRAGNAVFSGKSLRVYPAGTDIGRPAGSEKENRQIEMTRSLLIKLLITVILGTLAIFAIIYVMRKLKKY